jgi:hypothetical protein
MVPVAVAAAGGGDVDAEELSPLDVPAFMRRHD